MPPDFSRKIVDTVAKRAGYKCSNPECCCPTVGPTSDTQTAIIIGEAAHIYGARPGAARFLERMSDFTRSEITNAIWLCRNCHKIVDRDENSYSADLLFEWREQHEHDIASELGKSNTLLRLKLEEQMGEGFRGLPPLVRRIILDKPDGWEWQLTAEMMRFLNGPVFRRYRDLREGLYTRPAETISDEDLLSWFQVQTNEMANLIGPLTNLLNRLNAAWGVPGQSGDANEIIHICKLLKEALERVVEQEERIEFAHVDEKFERLVTLLQDALGSQAQKFEEIPLKLDQAIALIGEDHEGTIEQPKIIHHSVEFSLPDNWNRDVERELKRLERHLTRNAGRQAGSGCTGFTIIIVIVLLLLIFSFS